jgi:hypothetical protein
MALTSDAAAAVREGAERAAEGARSVLVEFLEAVRSAAYSILDEQKARAAKEVGDIAEAVRASARSLEQSDNPAIARYIERAAERIEHFSGVMRERSWNDILADTEELAQRRPTLFVLGAIGAGFAAGWLASLAEGRRAPNEREEPLSRYAEIEAPAPSARSAPSRNARRHEKIWLG